MVLEKTIDRYIDIGVGALIFDDEGRLILVRDKVERGGFWQGRWILPGGMLKVGEDLDSGILREVKEETGLTIRLDSGVPVVTERIVMDGGDDINGIRSDDDVRLHVIYVVKRGSVISGDLMPASDVGEAIWIGGEREIDDVRGELHADTMEILERFGVMGVLV